MEDKEKKLTVHTGKDYSVEGPGDEKTTEKAIETNKELKLAAIRYSYNLKMATILSVFLLSALSLIVLNHDNSNEPTLKMVSNAVRFLLKIW